jgi:hypothetical protein
VERKAALRHFVAPGGRSRTWMMLLTMGALFEEICRRDLEGIIVKWARGRMIQIRRAGTRSRTRLTH